MAGRKLSAKVEEEVVFMESLLTRLDNLQRPIEEYATATKHADTHSQTVVRQLQEMRQHAMMKNLGPVADAAGGLSVQCSRGSQLMRTRTMREGTIQLKVLIERTIKAAIEADQRVSAERLKEEERARAAEKAAAQRMAERVLREEELAKQAAAAKAAAAPAAKVAQPAAPAAKAAQPAPAPTPEVKS